MTSFIIMQASVQVCVSTDRSALRAGSHSNAKQRPAANGLLPGGYGGLSLGTWKLLQLFDESF